MKLQEAIENASHHVAYAKELDVAYIGDSTVEAAILECLLAEIIRLQSLVTLLKEDGERFDAHTVKIDTNAVPYCIFCHAGALDSGNGKLIHRDGCAHEKHRQLMAEIEKERKRC